MIIRPTDLDPEGLDVDTPLELEPLGLGTEEAIRTESVAVRGHVQPTRLGLSFRGRITGRLQVPCARCASPFTLDLDRPFDLIYAHTLPSGREIQIAEDDLDVAFLPAGEGIDLKQVAEEQIFLEIPMKPLCRPSCRGLCPRCGADLNRGDCGCAGASPQF